MLFKTLFTQRDNSKRSILYILIKKAEWGEKGRKACVALLVTEMMCVLYSTVCAFVSLTGTAFLAQLTCNQVISGLCVVPTFTFTTCGVLPAVALSLHIVP